MHSSIIHPICQQLTNLLQYSETWKQAFNCRDHEPEHASFSAFKPVNGLFPSETPSEKRSRRCLGTFLKSPTSGSVMTSVPGSLKKPPRPMEMLVKLPSRVKNTHTALTGAGQTGFDWVSYLWVSGPEWAKSLGVGDRYWDLRRLHRLSGPSGALCLHCQLELF